MRITMWPKSRPWRKAYWVLGMPLGIQRSHDNNYPRHFALENFPSLRNRSPGGTNIDVLWSDYIIGKQFLHLKCRPFPLFVEIKAFSLNLLSEELGNGENAAQFFPRTRNLKQQDKRRGDSPVSGMDRNLQDASCWIRAETLLLYIFLSFLFLLINLKFLRKVFFLYTIARRKRCRIFEHVRFSATKQKAAFGSASHIFFEFSAWKFASSFCSWY